MFDNEHEAAEAYLGTGVVFVAVAAAFFGLGVQIDDNTVALTAYLCGAIMLAIAAYCGYVAYCGLVD